MTVTRFQDLPLAAHDRAWDSAAAEKRVRSFTDARKEPNHEYRDVHLWYDGEAPDNFTAFKLLIADVVDGHLMVVPRAVQAAGGVLDGARGGVDIPRSDVDRVRAHLAHYSTKMGSTPPWERTS